ncbi:MAG: inositol monophosphatase family protein [Candidatus Limnocylindrales bacterium]
MAFRDDTLERGLLRALVTGMDDDARAPNPFRVEAFDATACGAEWSATLRRGTESELRDWLSFALGGCDKADAIALSHFQRDLEITAKPDRTLVTQVDRAIEALLREQIQHMYPGHGLVGEEYGSEARTADTRWYIDPIDGTHNYVRGVPIFATLLAVERDGEVQVGVLSAPALHQRWFAWRGGGAWTFRWQRNGPGTATRMGVSRIGSLSQAQLLYGSPFEVLRTGWAPGFADLVARVWRDRGFGDFWGYALLAEGAAEAMIEVGIHPWDLAAPSVLVEEAGGRLTDFGGRRRLDTATIVASNGWLHGAILTALQGDSAPEPDLP